MTRTELDPDGCGIPHIRSASAATRLHSATNTRGAPMNEMFRHTRCASAVRRGDLAPFAFHAVFILEWLLSAIGPGPPAYFRPNHAGLCVRGPPRRANRGCRFA